MLQVKQVPCMKIAPEKINIKRPQLENEKQRNFCNKLYRKREKNITNCSI